MTTQKAPAKLPTDVPERPVTVLSTSDVGIGSRMPGNIPVEEVWAIAKSIWGDEIPSKTAWAIWGETVVGAWRVEDCPECGFAGDIFVLCDYHQSRQCEICGGILGTLTSCRCP